MNSMIRSKANLILVGIVLTMMTVSLAGCGVFEAGIETPVIPGASETKEPEDTDVKQTEGIDETVAVPGEYAYSWYGRIVSFPVGSQFDDYVSIYPEGTAQIGIEGANAQLEEQIIDLRDKPEPGRNAHFWGTLICPAIDYGSCQLRVDSMRVDGPGEIFEPDAVEGWVGTIETGRTEPGSGGDDYFQLDGDFAMQYGVVAALNASDERELEPQIETLRDTGTRVRIWGRLVAGIPDWNGTQIEVTRLEILP